MLWVLVFCTTAICDGPVYVSAPVFKDRAACQTVLAEALRANPDGFGRCEWKDKDVVNPMDKSSSELDLFKGR